MFLSIKAATVKINMGGWFLPWLSAQGLMSPQQVETIPNADSEKKPLGELAAKGNKQHGGFIIAILEDGASVYIT